MEGGLTVTSNGGTPQSDDDGHQRRLHRPTLDDFIFEGEETPLLLQRRVVFAVVAGFVLLIVAYIVASTMLGLSFNVDADPLRDWVDEFGAWGPVVFIVFMAVSVLFAPIPNIPIFIAAGLIWGPILGTTYSMAGMMLGSTMAFGVSRALGRKHLHRLIGAKAAQRMDDMADHLGGRLVFWSRMIPVINFDIISYVAGLTSVQFPVFFLYSFLGMLTPTTIAVVAGDSLEDNFGLSVGLTSVWIAGILLSALYFWNRRRRWNSRHSGDGAATVQ